MLTTEMMIRTRYSYDDLVKANCNGLYQRRNRFADVKTCFDNTKKYKKNGK